MKWSPNEKIARHQLKHSFNEFFINLDYDEPLSGETMFLWICLSLSIPSTSLFLRRLQVRYFTEHSVKQNSNLNGFIFYLFIFIFSYVVTANESDPGATAFFGCDKGKVTQ